MRITETKCIVLCVSCVFLMCLLLPAYNTTMHTQTLTRTSIQILTYGEAYKLTHLRLQTYSVHNIARIHYVVCDALQYTDI